MSFTNVTFTGNIHDSSGSIYTNDEVKYQLYFYNENGISSPSKWSSTRLSEYGQYNINLGDSDILTPEGNVNSGDKVIICFWTPNTSIRTDNNLIEWGFTETTLTSSTDYIQNVQLKEGIIPICDFELSGTHTINSDVIATDTSSNDNHSWVYDGITIYQEPTRYGQPLFYVMNSLQSSSIDINWGDGNWSYNLDPAESYTHQYVSPSSYDITTYVTNTTGLSASQVFLWNIYYNTPIINFNIDNETPNPIGTTGIGELITFTNTTTDPDNRSLIDGWTCDWEIEDGVYSVSLSGQSFDYVPTHQFHSSGLHNITLTIHWYNGFVWLTDTITKQVNQQQWSVANGLTWPTNVYVSTPTTFTPTITGDTTYVTSVDYLVGGYDNIDGLGVNEPFIYTFAVSDSHTMRQTINYHTGFNTSTSVYTFVVNMTPLADFIVSDDTCGDIYTSISEPGKQPIMLYRWIVKLNTTEIARLEGMYTSVFRYNWPTIGTYTVTHEIIDDLSQLATITKTYYINQCKNGTGRSGGGGGDAGGPPRIIYREKPFPRVVVKLKKLKKEPEIKLTVNLINT